MDFLTFGGHVLRGGKSRVHWQLPEAVEGRASSLAAKLEVHPLAASVLVNRGYDTPEAVTAFLSNRLTDLPDPRLMKGMDAAVEVLVRALESNKKITLYGDYDVDGVCSTSLLCLFLRSLGANVATYIPHRLGEGYGLNAQAIERIAADGTQVLVTLDCGITSVAEVSQARERGLLVVIVDHHTVPEGLPSANAVLNPHRPGCDYPTKHLCAAGVAFNLCMAMRKRMRDSGGFGDRPEPNLRALLDLVALATVADVVPLKGANRVLVKHGLEELAKGTRPGIRALKEVAGLEEGMPVSAGQVGFRLGPRINAAGRLDDASLGMRLLCCESIEDARSMALALDSANSERQLIEAGMLEEAYAQAGSRLGARGLVLYSPSWHAGVIGIVASRVVEKFHRPTVMVALKDGVGKGSGRSIEAFHLFEALAACSGHLAKFGGHKHAAGLTIEEDRLPMFRDAFEKHASERLREQDLVRRCKIDAVVSLSQLDTQAVNAIEALGPFGNGNPEPVFATRRLATQPRVLTNKRKGEPGHLKLALEAAPHLDAIGFGMADRLGLTEGPVDLAYQMAIDSWQGRQRIQLKLKDLQLSA